MKESVATLICLQKYFVLFLQCIVQADVQAEVQAVTTSVHVYVPQPLVQQVSDLGKKVNYAVKLTPKVSL